MTSPTYPPENVTADMTLALALAEFTHGLQYSDLSDPLKQKAAHHITDAIGLGFAARQFPFAAPSIEGIERAGATGHSTVIGSTRKLSARDAAMANGLLMHGLDFDDTHPSAIVHPTVACLPAALAVAEEINASWEELLVAYVAAMETAVRLGAAVKGGFHHVGFHATGVISHFSSVIAAGKLLGLSVSQLVAAQGVAGSTASGIQVFLEEGAWTKRMHPGWGSLSGITAVHMAQAGFVGPSRPYEGRFGLFETHLHDQAASVDNTLITEGLGQHWSMMETSIKPYPVCHFIHGCAEAAIQLHRAVPDVEKKISEIICYLPEPTLPIVAEPADKKITPQTDYDAKFSAQFVVAACLARGRFGLEELSDASLKDAAILNLSQKARCVIEENSPFPRYFSGGVRICLEDGSEYSHHIDVNLGSGERALQAADIAEKFRGTAGLTLNQERMDTILKVLLSGRPNSARDFARLLEGSQA